jgi:hypothetical protein
VKQIDRMALKEILRVKWFGIYWEIIDKLRRLKWLGKLRRKFCGIN